MSSSTARLTHDAYTVGWISALPLEMAAAMAILDASHASLPQPNADHNTYHLGEIGQHNIVLACLPNGIYGLASAAVIAKQMMMTFPSVEFGLMVGIGGGAPSESADIRLGDVVVSKPTNGHPGVVQYDYGKTLANGVFHRTGTLNNPPEVLLTAISDVQAKHKLGINHINTHLESAATRNPSLSQSCKYPGASLDILFESSYDHPTGAVSCMGCESSRRILRPPRTSTEPHVHYGLIASANQVMKDSRARDNLRQELGILCYEMEAAGLANHFPCLVIRGISDYSDSHKNKGWQDYAAATAAAYARGLLEFSVRTIVRKPESGSARIRSRIPISKSTFCGRKLELEQIRQCLDGSTQVRQGAVIWGFSGFGKSQLALQYITSRGAEYGSLLWIDCSSQATIDQSLEDIMSELQPSTRIGRSAVDIVLAWLEQDTNNSWIMVLDGVENMNDADSVNDIDIRMLFPSCSHGHILLITTSPDLHVRLGFPGISIQNVDDRTGAEILMVSAGASIDDANRSVGMAISRKLGGMPLAIQQAGSFLSYGLTSMRDYNRQFQTRYLDPTLKTPMKKYVGSYDKGRTLWMTFDLSYGALKDKYPDSIGLLNLVAFLGPGRIPFNTLYNHDKKHDGDSDLFDTVCSLTERQGPFSHLLHWLQDMRSDENRLGHAIKELETAGFVRLHRMAGDPLIDSILIHNLARSFIRTRVLQTDLPDVLATALLLGGLQLYDGSQTPKDAILRGHMGRLVEILDMFLERATDNMLQPPDGVYFRVCAIVVPVYARVCRSNGRFVEASDLWTTYLQYRLTSNAELSLPSEVHLEDIMEAAVIDAKVGNLDNAIEKYSTVITQSESTNLQDTDIPIRASNCLRQLRERNKVDGQSLERAVTAYAAPKAVPNNIQNDVNGFDVDDTDWELRPELEYPETLDNAEQPACFNPSRESWYDGRPYREYMWKFYLASQGPNSTHTSDALKALFFCCYKAGGLSSKIVEDFDFARGWAEVFGSPTLTYLFRTPLGFDIYQSLIAGDQEAMNRLLCENEFGTAVCWASLLPHPTQRRVMDHLNYGTTASTRLDMNLLLLELSQHQLSITGIKKLLEMGANPNHTDAAATSALHVAASGSDPGLYELLIAHGANPNQVDINGQTAIHLLSISGRNNMDLKVLFEHGASVSIIDKSGQTPLHLATHSGNIPTLETLLNCGADISCSNRQGQAALSIAAMSNQVHLVLYLLDRGSNVLQTDRIGRSALHYAAHHVQGRKTEPGSLTVIKGLLEALEKEVELSRAMTPSLELAEIINRSDIAGRTALYEAVDTVSRYAAYSANLFAGLYTVEALMDRGADPRIPDLSGRTVLDIVASDWPSSGHLTEVAHAIAQIVVSVDSAQPPKMVIPIFGISTRLARQRLPRRLWSRLKLDASTETDSESSDIWSQQ